MIITDGIIYFEKKCFKLNNIINKMYNNGKLITFGTLLSVGAKEVILLTKNKTKKKTNI